MLSNQEGEDGTQEGEDGTQEDGSQDGEDGNQGGGNQEDGDGDQGDNPDGGQGGNPDGDQGEEEITYAINLILPDGKSRIEFGAEAVTGYQLQIEANVGWTAELLFESGQQQGWCSYTSAADGISLSCIENPTTNNFFNSRKATLRLSSIGHEPEIVQEYEIYQAAETPELNIELLTQGVVGSVDEGFHQTAESQKYEFRISSNFVPTTIEISNIYNGSIYTYQEENIVEVSIYGNTTTEQRINSLNIVGYLVVDGREETFRKTIMFTQDGLEKTLTLSQTEPVTLGYENSSIKVTVESNFPWIVTSSADWITFSSTEGVSGTKEITVTALFNPWNSEREATVTFSDKESTISQSFTVKQRCITGYDTIVYTSTDGEKITNSRMPSTKHIFQDGYGVFCSLTSYNPYTEIPGSAFVDCMTLETIYLPESVTSIKNGAFFNCTNLKRVEVLGKLTSIGSLAFAGTTSLTEIKLAHPESLTDIGEYAFLDSKIPEENIPTVNK